MINVDNKHDLYNEKWHGNVIQHINKRTRRILFDGKLGKCNFSRTY